MEPRQRTSQSDGSVANSSGEREITPATNGTGKGLTGCDVRLEKRVGLFSGVALIVGTMIGSGIFISPKGVAEGSGSVGLSLINWLICGVVSMGGALSFAELGTAIPRSGGEYAYVLTVFRSAPAFLCVWTSMLILRPAAAAIMALSCAEYLLAPFTGVADGGGCAEQATQLPLRLLATLVISMWPVLHGALAYAELGTTVAASGAEYAYLMQAFRPLQKVVGALPAFLFCWINTTLLRPASVSIIMLTFATYATEPFYGACNASVGAQKCLAALGIIIITVVNCVSVRLAVGLQNVLTITKLVAIGIIVIGCVFKLGQVLLSAVNIYSVRVAAKVQVIFTIGKLAALAIIIVGGIVQLGRGYTKHFQNSFENTETRIGKIAIGLYKGMWAYDGWNNLNYVTEELIDPSVNLPRAVMIGVPLVTVCYLLVNVSYFTVMSIGEVLESPAVAVTWGNRVLGVMAWLIPLTVACSTFGSANGTLFSTGRLSYVASREGHTPEILSMVHVRKMTPMPSLIFTSLLSLVFIIPGNVGSLIDFFSFAVWLFYGGTMVALLVLRFTQPDLKRPYKVPIVIPILVLIVAVFLVLAPIVNDPRIEFLYAFLFIVSGLIVYVPFVHYKMYPPFMGKFTAFSQLLMEVVPPAEDTTC